MQNLAWLAFDGLGLVIVIISATAALLVAWGGLGLPRLWDYYALVILLVVLALVMAGASNVILFYVVWEVLAFAAWGLGRWASAGERQTMMGALPLQGFGALGSLGMCIALVMLALHNRALGIAELVEGDMRTVSLLLLGAIVLKSFALLSPAWYPIRDGRSFFSAQAAVATAGLLGVGLYPYLRLLFVNMAQRSEWRGPAFEAGIAIALLLGVAALGEHDVHKLFAYAAFSQFGGLIAFFALLRPADLPLVVITLVVYALAIAGLSLCLAGVVEVTGQRDLRRMGGLFNKMPLVATLFLLCALSLAGLPPLGGFVGRLVDGGTLFVRGEGTAGYLLFALGAVTLLYFLRLFHAAFLREPAASRSARRPRPRAESVPAPAAIVAGIFVVGLLVVGLLPGRTLEILQQAIPFGGK